MIKARPIRIALSVCAVAATLALSVLPSEHLHTLPGGPPIVHRHVVDDADGHGSGSAFDHADHLGVEILDPTLVFVRQTHAARPMITVEIVVVEPRGSFAGRVTSIDAVMTHGPPVRVDSLRAPPA